MNFPEDLILPQEATLGTQYQTQSEETHGGKRPKNRIGSAHQWKLEITTPELDFKRSMRLFAFIHSLQGQFQNFSIRNPIPAIGVGVNVGATVAVTAEQFSTLITIERAFGGQLSSGDLISFSNHPKVYMVINDASANSQGKLVVDISPPLFQRISKGGAVHTGNNVYFSMEMTKDSYELSLNAKSAKEQKLVLQMEEAWRA
ncbi:hypothetical protein [Pseudoalteromonas peptidolytica]|uniref:Uncharacterized protein n=1 Tax=Pseudoalteromonas peptidolytica F12-50-A1 TaxID=1315280 RepID=A0A8I0T7K3_9GAMM|nr:hypothetical protein [Pseudoalteromonas peptidolytica]MBE0348289.1 hypothetical protein [Pseudoalteromonas peptidolytica F12-50-A1]NLR16573.1 hypothetical protein [Pseudoalteromonas peptidolytica]GEK08943.1 hypothetical protein PPE03_11920 [Pseudoalteromonas peptidolytica]